MSPKYSAQYWLQLSEFVENLTPKARLDFTNKDK